MAFKISSLLLSSAYFTFALSIQPLFISKLSASNDLQENASEKKSLFNKANFYKRKYSFLEPVADMVTLSNTLVRAEDENERAFLLAIFEEESEKGNILAQEKLYFYYTSSIPILKKLNLTDPLKADVLLKLGLKQNQAWAYWENAEKNKKSSTEVMTEHFLASNLAYPKAKAYLEKNDSDNWQAVLESFKVMESQDTIYLFCQKYVRKQYALPLVNLIKRANDGKLFMKENIFWSISKAAADLEDLESLNEYAKFHYRKNQSSKNFFISFEYFKKGADRGHLNSIYNVAQFYKNGFRGQNPDKEKALSHYVKYLNLSDSKDPILSEAIFNLGCLLEGGIPGQEPDEAKAFECYSKATELGNDEAKFSVAHMLEKGFLGQKPDKEKALKYYLEVRDAKSMCNAGYIVEKGYPGHKADKAKAMEYYLEAKALKDAKGTFNAGYLFHTGFPGQKPDLPKALECYLIAETLGHPNASYNAGLIIGQDYPGHKADKAKALEFFLRGKAQGNADAGNEEGLIYLNGFKGQNPDKAKAFKCFQPAARLGSLAAMNNIANLYREGFKGQNPNRAKALRYHQQAANQNSTVAMVNLAIMYLESYESNIESQENLSSALFWLEKARAQKDKRAGRYLDIAEKCLSDIQTEKENKVDAQLEKLLQENSFIKGSNPLSQSDISREDESNLNEDKKPIIKDLEENPKKEEVVSPSAAVTSASFGKIQKNKILLSDEEAKPTKILNQETSSDEEEFDLESQPLSKEDNLKLIQKNLRQIALFKKERDVLQNEAQTLKLSPKAQEIAESIKSEESGNIDYNVLRILFKDPAFQNQVEIRNTKSGILISAHNRASNQHATASTHHKHTKFSKKGIQSAFVKSLSNLLGIFPHLN